MFADNPYMIQRSVISFSILLSFIVCPQNSQAEEFRLKNGTVVEGTILVEEDDALYVDTGKGVIQIERKKLVLEAEAERLPEKSASEKKLEVIQEKIAKRVAAKKLESFGSHQKRALELGGLKLQARKKNLWGRVATSDGEPIEGAVIYLRRGGAWSGSMAWSLENGYYKVVLTTINGKLVEPVEAVKVVWAGAGDEKMIEGPWTENAEINFTFSAEGNFFISGKVLDPDGGSADGATVTLNNVEGKGVTSKTIGKDGSFKIPVGQKIKSISVYYSKPNAYNTGTILEGPWSENTNVEIQLEAPQDNLKSGTTFEVGKNYGEIIITQ